MQRFFGLMALACGGTATPARADIQVSWGATLGFFSHDANPGSPADPTDNIRDFSQPGAGGVVAVLLWSPDSSFGTMVNVGTLPAAGDHVTTDSNDIVLNATTGANAPHGDYSVGTGVYLDGSYGGMSLQSGFITAVINQDLGFDVGDWHNQGEVVSAAAFLVTGGEPSVVYDHNTGDHPIVGGQLDRQVTLPPPPTPTATIPLTVPLSGPTGIVALILGLFAAAAVGLRPQTARRIREI